MGRRQVGGAPTAETPEPEDRLSPRVMVGPRDPRPGKPQRRSRRAQQTAPESWSRKAGRVAVEAQDRRLRGAGTLGRHWAAGYVGVTIVKPPGVNGTSTPGCRGLEACRPQSKGNRVSGMVTMLAEQRAPSMAPQSSTPTPRKAVWAQPPGGTCSLQPLGLSWFRLSQEEAKAGPKLLPGARAWGLRYTVTLRQGCGGRQGPPCTLSLKPPGALPSPPPVTSPSASRHTPPTGRDFARNPRPSTEPGGREARASVFRG